MGRGVWAGGGAVGRRGAGAAAQPGATGVARPRPGVAVARRASGAAGVGLGRAGGLSALDASIRAVAGGSGRTAMAPEILFGRWLYATLEGVGSARALARLTQEHDAYRWICGGASVTDHPLAAFRSAQGAAFDAWLTESVAVLLAAGVVSRKRVAQEGLRVRASAGAAAFRRGATLEACLEQAREQVERLKRQDEDDPGAASRRQQAARERQARLERALQRRPERAEIKAKDPDTDPHVRKEGDRAAVGAGRERLGTEAATAIYPERAATAEGVNAQARERGLTRLRVRGTAKVRGVLLLHALAHPLMRTLAVAPHRLGYGRGASAETAMAT